MTSTLVMSSLGTQAMSLMNSVTTNITKTGSADFKNFMDLAGNTGGQTAAETVKPTVSSDKSEAKASPQETTETMTAKPTSVGNEQKPADTLKETEVSEEDVTVVDNAIGAVKEAIEEELQITDEELLTALENLGLNPLALLDTDKIPAIIAEVTDSPNVLAIATDPKLYEALTVVQKEVTVQLETITTDLSIPADDFKASLKEAEVLPEKEAVPEFTEILPKEQAVSKSETLAEKIQITVLPKAKEAAAETPVVAKEEVAEEEPEMKTTHSVETIKADADMGSKTETFRPVTETYRPEEHTEVKEKEPSLNPVVDFTKNLLNKVVETFNEAAEVPASYTEVDVASVINQMTESIQAEVTPETSEINLRLHPESLGSVTVKVSQNHEGVMRAQFTTQNESVKAIVESQAIYLKETLESKGVKVEAVEVLVQSHEFERNLSDQNRQNGANEQKGRNRNRIRRIDLTEGIEGLAEGSEEDTIVKEMMAANGNTIDYSA